MKYRAWLVAIIFAVALLLSGCDDGIQQGWIYAKHYYPPYYSYDPGYTTRSCIPEEDGKEHCYSVYHPGHEIYNDAQYELDISSCRRNIDNSECKSNALYVDEHDYDSYAVGTYYGAGQ